MKSVLVIYKSKTGFTKKYADWILEDVACNVATFDKVKKEDIMIMTSYDNSKKEYVKPLTELLKEYQGK